MTTTEARHDNIIRATHIVIGIVILLSCLMGGVAMAVSNIRRSQVFHLWFRHMTSWNAIIASLWFFLVATTPRSSNTMFIAFGLTTLLLNLFVFFVRWGWFRISSLHK